MLDNADESVKNLTAFQRESGSSSHFATSPEQISGPFHQPPRSQQVCFDRIELMAILNVYGRMVAAGEWRDYAIDTLKDRAVFSIFRRTSEMPLYRIEKNPKLARRQGAYSLITQHGQILKRGQDLEIVLRLLNQKHLKLVKT